jgi:hypothetical protein
MQIPATIRAGSTVQWLDNEATDSLGNAITSSTYALTYYLRFNAASEGATVVGSNYASGWQFTIAASTSAGFEAGTWYWQAVATSGSISHTLGAGQSTVEAALNYTGTPTAFDGRTQSQKDLDSVQAAIRAIVSGGAVSEYTIGTRRLKKMDMADLVMLESRLKGMVIREQKAALIANGLGNPTSLYVRF